MSCLLLEFCSLLVGVTGSYISRFMGFVGETGGTGVQTTVYNATCAYPQQRVIGFSAQTGQVRILSAGPGH
jgi:hypothetical protein